MGTNVVLCTLAAVAAIGLPWPLLAAAATTFEVSASAAGADANAHSSAPSVDGDGGLIAFESDATNLLTSGQDTNGVRDILVKNTTTGSVGMASIGSTGTQSNGSSYAASIDSAGDLVVYDSVANNLGSNLTTNCSQGQGDCNHKQDVFIHDLRTGTNTLISLAYGGTRSGNGTATAPIISADGSTVVYQSNDTDLTCPAAPCTGEVRAYWNIYSYNVQTGVTTLLTPGENGDSKFPWTSGDGSRVSLYSTATNLVPSPPTSGTQVYERAAGGFTLVSQAGGAAGNGVSSLPMMSADGSTIVYDSRATNITRSATTQAVAFSTATGMNTVVSACLSTCAHAGSAGAPGNQGSGVVYSDATAAHVAFVSNATNISSVAPTDGKRSLFVWTPATGPVWEDAGNVYIGGPAIGTGGHTVAWTSSATSGFDQASARVYSLTL